MHNQFVLLCMKLVVAICEPTQSGPNSDTFRVIAVNSAGSVPMPIYSWKDWHFRDPRIPEVLIPNPVIEKLGPGLQSLIVRYTKYIARRCCLHTTVLWHCFSALCSHL